MKKTTIASILLAALSGTVYADRAPEPAPLNADELAHCAAQVQLMRSESERLWAQADADKERREQLRALYKKSSDSPEQLLRYNEQAQAFNKRMYLFRLEVGDINEVRDAYENDCANRPYQRERLNDLPEAKAQAMREGLGDVRLPRIRAAETVEEHDDVYYSAP